MEKILTISLNNRSIKTEDGFKYPIKKQFFNLYLLLVLERIEPNRSNSGFVDINKIAELEFWERNKSLSIGKQIRRHILLMEGIGRNVIESVQKINGPYRLILKPSQIVIDENINDLRDFLGFNNLNNISMQKDEETFFTFVEKIWEGDILFNEGNLKNAMVQYESAIKEGKNSGNIISAMHRLGRVLERLGKYKEAEDTYRKAKKLIHSERPHYYRLLAENNAYESWLQLRQREIKKAEKLSFKALDLLRGTTHDRLLGDIYNTFGKIRELNNKFDKALSYYKRSLSFWVAASYFYGIQACYFNIGNLYKIWADNDLKLNNFQLTDYAIDKYEKAIRWAKECGNICDRTGLGYDTSQSLIVASYCYYRLEKFNESLITAEQAKKFADVSGNTQDLAASCKRLGIAYWNLEESEKATRFLNESTNYYTKLGNTKEVIKIQEKMKELEL